MRTICITLALLLGVALTQAQNITVSSPTVDYCSGDIPLGGDIVITEGAAPNNNFLPNNRRFVLTFGSAYKITNAGTVTGAGLNIGSNATITDAGNLEVTYNVEDDAVPNTVVLSGIEFGLRDGQAPVNATLSLLNPPDQALRGVDGNVVFATVNASPAAVISNFPTLDEDNRLCRGDVVNFDISLSSGDFTTVTSMEIRGESSSGSPFGVFATYTPGNPVGTNATSVSVSVSRTWRQGDQIYVIIRNEDGCETESARQTIFSWLDAAATMNFIPDAGASSTNPLSFSSHSFTTSPASESAILSITNLDSDLYTITQDGDTPIDPVSGSPGSYSFEIDREGFYFFDLNFAGCTSPINITVNVQDNAPSQLTGILNSTFCEGTSNINIGWVSDGIVGDLERMEVIGTHADAIGINDDGTYFINRSYLNTNNVDFFTITITFQVYDEDGDPIFIPVPPFNTLTPVFGTVEQSVRRQRDISISTTLLDGTTLEPGTNFCADDPPIELIGSVSPSFVDGTKEFSVVLLDENGNGSPTFFTSTSNRVIFSNTATTPTPTDEGVVIGPNPYGYRIDYRFITEASCSFPEPGGTLIYVNPNPPAISAASFERSYCLGEAFTLINFDAESIIDNNINVSQDSLVWFTETGIPIATIARDSAFLPDIVSRDVAGTYNFIVRQLSAQGCLGEPTTVIIRVSSPPVPDFYFLEVSEEQTLQLVNLTKPGDPNPISDLQTFEWQIVDVANPADPPAFTTTTSYVEDAVDIVNVAGLAAGIYDVTLNAINVSGCPTPITKKMVVHPLIEFNDANGNRYQEGFEADAGGWVSSVQTDNGNNPTPDEPDAEDIYGIYGNKGSWALGAYTYTDPEEQAEVAVQAWVTNNGSGTYIVEERSWVESPSFRLDQLEQPFISLRLRHTTDLEDDGITLLYSRYVTRQIDPDVDDQRVISWEPVGELEAGINWYNSDGIAGIPTDIDDRRKGWSGESEGWFTARYDLSTLNTEGHQPNEHIRFRLYFASNADISDDQGEGVTFDAVEVGNKNRTVLIEHFSNLNDPVYQDPDIETFLSGTPEEDKVYNEIRYHTTLPARDAISMQNQPDNSGRQLHYKVANPPQAVIDGSQLDVTGAPFTTWGASAEAAYNRRTLFGSPFDIAIATPDAGGSLTIEATVTRNNASDIAEIEEAILVHIAIVEKEVEYQGATLRNVVAKMLPHAAGTRFDQAWEEGQQVTVTQTWQPDRAGDFAVIVFVANEVTKEIYQSAYQDIVALTGGRLVEGRAARAEVVQLYPNPTEQRFRVALPAALTQAQDWTVYDVLGTPLIRGTWPLNTWKVDIDASRLAEGTYIFQMGEVKKFFVVMR
ncbi:MAG: T9SS type A sorting domain-containing protein [Thermonemataceae bacterium]